MIKIDATGLSCPEPVILLKRVLDKSPNSCEITVDNHAARENCARCIKHAGYDLEINEAGGVWTLAATQK